jgi:hypothetical protein
MLWCNTMISIYFHTDLLYYAEMLRFSYVFNAMKIVPFFLKGNLPLS